MQTRFSTRPSGPRLALQAWKSTGEAVTRMPVLMLSVLAASLVAGVATYFIAIQLPITVHPDDVRQGILSGIPRGVLLAALKAIVVAPLAVAMHRFILLDELTPSLTFVRRHTCLFFCWTFALQIFTLFLTLGTMSSSFGDFVTRTMLMIAMLYGSILVMWIITIYLAMIFPAVATDVPSAGPMQRILTSLRQMRGHFWQFVGGAVLAELPLVIPIWIVTYWFQYMLMHNYLMQRITHAHAPLQTGGWFLAICLTDGVESVAVVAVAAAVASWTYATLDLKK